MEPADSIGRLGFSRWYERQLIEGHVWLVTCFLCLVAVCACLEELTFHGSAIRLLALGGFIYAAATIGFYALQRYKVLLVEANRLAEHSTCAACGAYSRFTVIGAPLFVKCSRCGNEWKMF